MKHALRFVQRKPGFALAAILTIALGIGVNATVYNAVYATLIRPLPFRDPDRLLQLWEIAPTPPPQIQVSVPDFEDWRASAKSFDEMAAYTFQAMNSATLLDRGGAEAVQATMVTGNLFSMLGITPLLGNVFGPNAAKEALINEELWRRKFNADPAIVGRSMRLDGQSFTIAGVISKRQAFPAWADVYLPYSLIEPQLRATRKFHPLEVIARLKPGVTESAALAELQTIAANLSKQFPQTNGSLGVATIPLSRQLTGEQRPVLLLIWAAVGLVLLIVCVNVALMLLARTLDRRREMAVRAALGARGRQLVWQVLAESLTLAIAGGGAGAVFSMWAGAILHREDTPVWWFVPAASILCGLLCAVPSCWMVLETDLSLRTAFSRRSRLTYALLTAQVALAFLVLSGAGLLLRSFRGLLAIDPGFHAANVLALDLRMSYDWDHSAQFVGDRVLPALRGLPGVTAAAAVNSAPMTLGPTEHSRYASRFGVEGKTYEAGHYPVAQLRWVTPDYFRVLGIPLRGGRLLADADYNQSRYVINETMAREFFPGDDVHTRHLMMDVTTAHPNPVEIAGVVGDVREIGLDALPAPTIYLIATSPRMTVLIQTTGSLTTLSAEARGAVHRANPEVAVTNLRPLQTYVDESLARRRYAAVLLTAFAGLAAFLTAIGIHGLFSYSVSARSLEFGIRAAIGATPQALVTLVLREAATLAAVGLAAGIAATLAFSRLLTTLLYGVSSHDPQALAGAAAFLAAVALLAATLPARRASHADPTASLRAE